MGRHAGLLVLWVLVALGCAPTRSDADAGLVEDELDSGSVSSSDAGPDACGPSLTRCSGDCVDLPRDPKHCGACGRACAANEQCESGQCRPLPVDCRQSACPKGFYCDLASGACRAGCLKDSECPQPGVCDIASHACRCMSGRVCGTRCEVESVVSCGPSCQSCDAPANAQARCSRGKCSFACDVGFHLCGDECKADDSPLACGSSCQVCAAGPSAPASCPDGECALTCPAGKLDCNGNPADGCEAADDHLFFVLCYRDADGDGFGNKGVQRGYGCRTCPAGWSPASAGNDCNDADPKVHPPACP